MAHTVHVPYQKPWLKSMAHAVHVHVHPRIAQCTGISAMSTQRERSIYVHVHVAFPLSKGVG